MICFVGLRPMPKRIYCYSHGVPDITSRLSSPSDTSEDEFEPELDPEFELELEEPDEVFEEVELEELEDVEDEL